MNATHLVIGVTERDGGTLSHRAVLAPRTGAFSASIAKLMPTASERLIWGFGDGSTLPVIASNVGRIGAAIRWENYMPLLRAVMYAKGVEIYMIVGGLLTSLLAVTAIAAR